MKMSDPLPSNVKEDVTRVCDVAAKLDPGTVGKVYQVLGSPPFSGDMQVTILASKMQEFLNIPPRFFRVPQIVSDLDNVSPQGFGEQEALLKGAQYFIEARSDHNK